eukprot:142363-Pleurochrysis_carterae.AAC.2
MLENSLLSLFAGADCGFEKFVSEAPYALRFGNSASPACFIASRNLGNPAHLDVQDGSRCYVIWTFNNVQNVRKYVSETSWLLFPDHGLAVQLVDGVGVSWDGRRVSHCTSVLVQKECQVGTPDLFGLFTALPQAAKRSGTNQEEFWLARGVLSHGGGRHSPSGRDRLRVGQLVWVRLHARVDGHTKKKYTVWRRATMVVDRVVEDGAGEECSELRSGYVQLTGTTAVSSREVLKMSFKEYLSNSTCAGDVGTPRDPLTGTILVSEHFGSSIVGEKVRVWIYKTTPPKEDGLFDGQIEAYEEESQHHTILFDDGEVQMLRLGGPSAPHYSLLVDD